MECIFCKIIAKTIPAYVLYEDDDFIVILDKFPSVLGHSLIIPKTHSKDFFDLPEETAAKVLPLAKRIAERLKKATDCEGLNVLQNNGEAAGQTVAHYHIHLIPRYEYDKININWTPSQHYTDAEFSELLEKVRI
ncbi:protein hit [Clostridia bacterium]|nr:protein hit [Clostridia bacterium]